MKFNRAVSILTMSLFTLVAPLMAVNANDCTNCSPITVSAETIASYSNNAIQLAPNEDYLYDRRYVRVSQAIDIFDAPNGNVISSLAAGYNYLTTWAPEGEWTRINEGQWVRSEFLTQASPSRFSGLLLPEGLPEFTVGWLLRHTVPSRTAGAEPLDADQNNLLLRYHVINLFETQVVDGWEWYKIGEDQWVHQHNVARVLPVDRPEEVETEKWVSIDLYEQVAIAYEGDSPVFATLISSGLAEWPTNEGVFEVYIRYPRTIMSGAAGRPDFYYLEEVPWTQYFDGDIGLHGTYWHDGFGYRASHGCVNLSITDSAWMYNWAASEFDFTVSNDTGAAVYVFSSGEYR